MHYRNLISMTPNTFSLVLLYTMNVNLHMGCVDIPAADALNPLAPRHGILRQLLKRSRLVVHKIGASTDLYVAMGQPIVSSKPQTMMATTMAIFTWVMWEAKVIGVRVMTVVRVITRRTYY